jgi:hypothetical protein
LGDWNWDIARPDAHAGQAAQHCAFKGQVTALHVYQAAQHSIRTSMHNLLPGCAALHSQKIAHQKQKLMDEAKQLEAMLQEGAAER